MSEGFYVYGVMSANDVIKMSFLMGIDHINYLSWIMVEELAVVTSKVDLNEYGTGYIDQKLEDMLWVEEKARRHFDLVQQLTEYGTFIPMKFCTIFLNEENVKEFINQYLKKLREALIFFNNKEEWGVKVYIDHKKFLAQNMGNEKDEIDQQLSSLSKGVSYLLKKKMLTQLEDKTKNKITNILEDVKKELQSKFESVQFNKNLSKQVTEKKEDMVLNVAVLIEKDQLLFINELKEKLTTLHFRVEISNHRAFYNFSNLFIT